MSRFIDTLLMVLLVLLPSVVTLKVVGSALLAILVATTFALLMGYARGYREGEGKY